jgi:hypothetical protein
MEYNLLKTKTLYLIFGDARNQNYDDLEDLYQNIKHFDKNCEIIINHPSVEHPNVKIRHVVQPVNVSPFIFGVFTEFLKYIKKNPIEFDHVCLFSANQYMINNFKPEKHVNYLQFYNCPDWDFKYTGKDFTNTTIGNPLIQYGTFNWDQKGMNEILQIPNAMVSNWESAYLTKEAIELSQKYLPDCESIYPGRDCIQLFPGYMALKTGQTWMFPPFFGTFDPSNKINNHNSIITKEQIDQKLKEGYSLIKRVNYSKDCPLKEYIRSTIIS